MEPDYAQADRVVQAILMHSSASESLSAARNSAHICYVESVYRRAEGDFDGALKWERNSATYKEIVRQLEAVIREDGRREAQEALDAQLESTAYGRWEASIRESTRRKSVW